MIPEEMNSIYRNEIMINTFRKALEIVESGENNFDMFELRSLEMLGLAFKSETPEERRDNLHASMAYMQIYHLHKAIEETNEERI